MDLEQIVSLEISWPGSTLFLKESRSIYFEEKNEHSSLIRSNRVNSGFKLGPDNREK